MFDTHLDKAFEDCDGVLRYELFEGDQEQRLQGNAAGYGCQRSGWVAHDGSPSDIEWDCDQVGNDSGYEDDLPKFF